MGMSVHETLYEQAMDRLEQIVDEDPDYETDEESEFIGDLAGSGPSGFTTSQVRRIGAIYSKYVSRETIDDCERDDD